jgi:hypothetical protein
LVFSLDGNYSLTEDEKRKYLTIELYDPPFYQFGKISIIDCDRFFDLQLDDDFNIVRSTIENYETQCDYQDATDKEAVRLIRDHLAQNKIDISTLEEWLKSFPSPSLFKLISAFESRIYCVVWISTSSGWVIWQTVHLESGPGLS